MGCGLQQSDLGQDAIHAGLGRNHQVSMLMSIPLSRKKLKKEDGAGWEEAASGNQNSLQGGAHIYIIKCQELGVIPSTQ
eukprot:scaffold19957_cov18-Tisochrysis_lutea.AAC.2